MSSSQSDALLIRGGASQRRDVRVNTGAVVSAAALAVAALASRRSQLQAVTANPPSRAER